MICCYYFSYQVTSCHHSIGCMMSQLFALSRDCLYFLGIINIFEFLSCSSNCIALSFLRDVVIVFITITFSALFWLVSHYLNICNRSIHFSFYSLLLRTMFVICCDYVLLEHVSISLSLLTSLHVVMHVPLFY